MRSIAFEQDGLRSELHLDEGTGLLGHVRHKRHFLISELGCGDEMRARGDIVEPEQTEGIGEHPVALLLEVDRRSRDGRSRERVEDDAVESDANRSGLGLLGRDSRGEEKADHRELDGSGEGGRKANVPPMPPPWRVESKHRQGQRLMGISATGRWAMRCMKL